MLPTRCMCAVASIACSGWCLSPASRSWGGGAALAVLACGPDIAYPRRHLRLYETIVERGVVVSELEPGTHPFQWSFPARNRIMAALAEVVVVVEAREASGSLITSTFAAELGRDV